MANYKVGDTVICIDATPMPDCIAFPLALGAQYTITDVHHCKHSSVSIGLPWPNGGYACVACGYVPPNAMHLPHRFIKLDGLVETEDAKQESHA